MSESHARTGAFLRHNGIPIAVIVLTALAVAAGVYQGVRGPKPTPAPKAGVVAVTPAKDLPPEPPAITQISGQLIDVRGATLQVRIAEVRAGAIVQRLVLGEVTSQTQITEMDPDQALPPVPGATVVQPTTPIAIGALRIGDTVTITADTDIKTHDRFALTAVERVKRD